LLLTVVFSALYVDNNADSAVSVPFCFFVVLFLVLEPRHICWSVTFANIGLFLHFRRKCRQIQVCRHMPRY